MFAWFLAVLAVYRLARLVIEDDITVRFRDMIVGWRIEYFLSCYWCLGFWLSGVAALLAVAFGAVSGAGFLPFWFSVSAGVGLLSEAERFFRS